MCTWRFKFALTPGLTPADKHNQVHTHTHPPQGRVWRVCRCPSTSKSQRYTTHTYRQPAFYRNTGLGRNTFTIHMGTCRHTHTCKPNCLDPRAFRHNHVCADIRTDTETQGKSYSYPTDWGSPQPQAYTKRLKPTILYKPCRGHIHVHTVQTQTCSHIQEHHSGSLLHTQRQAGTMQAHTYTTT